MASYQVPQFLDSGDKIFLNMNIRQFAYALVGFFACLIFYNIVQSIVPGIGVYGLIPCLPIAGLFAYLAIGKFNGRDTEVYVLKAIVFFSKPRKLVYSRQPDYTDINNKLSEWTVDKVMARMNQETEKQRSIEDNDYNTFEQADYDSKIGQIRKLAGKVDKPYNTTLTSALQKEKELRQKEKLIQEIENRKKAATAETFKFEAPKLPTITFGGRKNDQPTKPDERFKED
jgi:rRNA processing protein Gar1